MVGAGLTNCKLLTRLLLQSGRLMRTSGTPLSSFPGTFCDPDELATPPKGHGTLNVVAYFFRWQAKAVSSYTN
jgi:hypothetical protein